MEEANDVIYLFLLIPRHETLLKKENVCLIWRDSDNDLHNINWKITALFDLFGLFVLPTWLKSSEQNLSKLSIDQGIIIIGLLLSGSNYFKKLKDIWESDGWKCVPISYQVPFLFYCFGFSYAIAFLKLPWKNFFQLVIEKCRRWKMVNTIKSAKEISTVLVKTSVVVSVLICLMKRIIPCPQNKINFFFNFLSDSSPTLYKQGFFCHFPNFRQVKIFYLSMHFIHYFQT